LAELCTWAVAHWVRFSEQQTSETLAGVHGPEGFALWKFGADVPPTAGSNRRGSKVWCGVGGFTSASAAEAAFEHPDRHIARLHQSCEAWHVLLRPIAHLGECNYLDREAPGPVFRPAENDPGGPLLVMTTAGFDLESKADFQRLIDFRRRVHTMRDVISQAEGSLGHQVFAPAAAGDDGATMSLWAKDKSMTSFAYQSGSHRSELDRQARNKTVDRSSFTRFRVLRWSGQWEGKSPI
jgi:hypothetical protein